MIADYEALLAEIGEKLNPARHATAVKLAELALDIKGYGHVKLANYETAKKKRDTLIGTLEKRLVQTTAAETLFTIRWEVV